MEKRSMPEIDTALIARLARLRLTDEEMASLQGELEAIVAFFDALGEADTQGVPEMTMPGALRNVLRDDLPAPSLPREEALASAPTQDVGCVTAPKMFEA